MIGAQSDPMGVDACGSEPMAGNESEGPRTQTSLEVESVFSAIAVECVASVVGSILPLQMARSSLGLRPRQCYI